VRARRAVDTGAHRELGAAETTGAGQDRRGVAARAGGERGGGADAAGAEGALVLGGGHVVSFVLLFYVWGVLVYLTFLILWWGFGGFGVWWSSPKTHSTDPTLSTF
jgi:hypothetical protein